MSSQNRYEELLLSAAVNGYNDERQKLADAVTSGVKGGVKAIGAGVKGAKSLPRILDWLGGTIGRAAERGAYTMVGPRLYGKATAQEAAHHLGKIGVPGAVEKTTKEIGEEAVEDLANKWRYRWTGLTPSERASAAAQKRALKEYEAQRKLFDITGGNYWGTTKGMFTHPKEMMRSGWQSGGKLHKGMVLGFAGMDAAELANWKQMTPEQRAATIARLGLSTPMWLGTMGLPGMVAPMVSYMAGTELPAYAIGKGVGAIAPRPPRPDAAKLMVNQ